SHRTAARSAMHTLAPSPSRPQPSAPPHLSALARTPSPSPLPRLIPSPEENPDTRSPAPPLCSTPPDESAHKYRLPPQSALAPAAARSLSTGSPPPLLRKVAHGYAPQPKPVRPRPIASPPPSRLLLPPLDA